MCEEGGNLSTRDLGFIYVSSEERLVENLYIPNNRRTTLQAEEALGPIAMPRGSQELTPFRGLDPLGRRNRVPILPPAHPLGGGKQTNIKPVNM